MQSKLIDALSLSGTIFGYVTPSIVTVNCFADKLNGLHSVNDSMSFNFVTGSSSFLSFLKIGISIKLCSIFWKNLPL